MTQPYYNHSVVSEGTRQNREPPSPPYLNAKQPMRWDFCSFSQLLLSVLVPCFFYFYFLPSILPVYDRVSHTPRTIFHVRYLHSWHSAGAQEVSVRNILPSALRRRIVRYWHCWHCWHPLGCRAIELGKLPQGGVICITHRRIRYYLRRSFLSPS